MTSGKTDDCTPTRRQGQPFSTVQRARKKICLPYAWAYRLVCCRPMSVAYVLLFLEGRASDIVPALMHVLCPDLWISVAALGIARTSIYRSYFKSLYSITINQTPWRPVTCGNPVSGEESDCIKTDLWRLLAVNLCDHLVVTPTGLCRFVLLTADILQRYNKKTVGRGRRLSIFYRSVHEQSVAGIRASQPTFG